MARKVHLCSQDCTKSELSDRNTFPRESGVGAGTLYFPNHRLQPSSVLNVIVPHGLLAAGLGIRVVENHNHVWFDGNARVVPSAKGVSQNIANPSLPFAGPIVIRIIFARRPG